MKVIEQFTCSKTGDDARNEDRIVVTDDFIAVLDGSTSKSGRKIGDATGGMFASSCGADMIAALPVDITARDAIDRLSHGLREAVTETGIFAVGDELPTYVVAIYSRYRKEIWRVGDIMLMTDGVVSLNEKDADRITASLRAVAITLAIKKGTSPDNIAQDDIGRALILNIIREQHHFANQDEEYGYGVINGAPVPDRFLQVIDAPVVAEIVLASDGYPELMPDLAASENRLAEIIAQDPLMYRIFKSTKGVQPGNISFDDRSYIRFIP